MKTPPEFRAAVQGLCDHVWAAATVAAVAESGLLASLGEPHTVAELAARHELPPSLVARQCDVLVSVGMAVRDGDRYSVQPGLAPFLAGQGRDILAADLRSTFLQAGDMMRQASRREISLGWSYTDPEILNAQGLNSAGAMEPIQKVLLPMLDGLLPRLSAPGGAFLDVGAGVAALSIAFARAFPAVRVVGLEPAPAPLAEAQKNVVASGLGDRIELRAETIQDLADSAAFDFIWLPQMFLPDAILAQALPVVLRALRPGGWLLTLAMAPPGDDLGASASRLRNTLWGGEARPLEELTAGLERAGFERVLAVPSPGLARPVVARRAP